MTRTLWLVVYEGGDEASLVHALSKDEAYLIGDAIGMVVAVHPWNLPMAFALERGLIPGRADDLELQAIWDSRYGGQPEAEDMLEKLGVKLPNPEDVAFGVEKAPEFPCSFCLGQFGHADTCTRPKDPTP